MAVGTPGVPPTLGYLVWPHKEVRWGGCSSLGCSPGLWGAVGPHAGAGDARADFFSSSSEMAELCTSVWAALMAIGTLIGAAIGVAVM